MSVDWFRVAVLGAVLLGTLAFWAIVIAAIWAVLHLA